MFVFVCVHTGKTPRSARRDATTYTTDAASKTPAMILKVAVVESERERERESESEREREGGRE